MKNIKRCWTYIQLWLKQLQNLKCIHDQFQPITKVSPPETFDTLDQITCKKTVQEHDFTTEQSLPIYFNLCVILQVKFVKLFPKVEQLRARMRQLLIQASISYKKTRRVATFSASSMVRRQLNVLCKNYPSRKDQKWS